MAKVACSYEHSLVTADELGAVAERLQPEIDAMQRATFAGYEDDRASINLPVDRDMLGEVNTLVEAKRKKLKPEYVIVAGIGGSNLGTIAVQEAVQGKLHNQLDWDTKVLYADTVDSDLIASIERIIEPTLKSGGNVILNGVSKSGSTTETIANFEVLVEVIKRYKRNYEESVIVTTDRGSKYWHFAVDHEYDVLEIPQKVGGRYSVFSPVGLVPLGLLGVDTANLLAGAADMRGRCLESDVFNNPAALRAALIYLHNRGGRNIHNTFLFATDLESVGKWYRQLMGESIGKHYNRRGEAVFEGITPTVSVGSTDLHSMAQLYLGGPQDTFTTFVTVKSSNSSITVPQIPDYSRLVKGIQGRTLDEIMDALFRGVRTAYINGKRPFSELILPDKAEHTIGQLLQLQMMEMMYLGFLLEVNPFDQPNVEDYKKETRKILEENNE